MQVATVSSIKGRPKIVADPIDKEIMEAVIQAACLYFDISEEQLMCATPGPNENVEIRRICFYIIKNNTRLIDRIIAERFNVARSCVTLSSGVIEAAIKVFYQTRLSVKTIITMANNFEKKYEWHIQ